MKRFLALFGFALSLPAWAAPWVFSEPLTVSDAHREGLFHHLESAGRRNIAVADGAVAVVWEDNRDGLPRVYVAYKAAEAKAFGPARQVSGKAAAYEPVLAALPQGQFLFGWEEAGQVWLRRGNAKGFVDLPVRLADPAGQVTLGAGRAGVYAAWGQTVDGVSRIHVAEVELLQKDLRVRRARPVEAGRGEQLYPSLAVASDAVFVAWEDRGAGHTRIRSSRADKGGNFAAAHPLNEIARRSEVFGRGPGAARVALAASGERVAAVWLDKREFQSGYGVYAAFSPASAHAFGANEKVQDDFGDTVPQWHPAVGAAPDGRVAVAWDDERDESPDLFLSWQTEAGWSEDLAVPGAAGAGRQCCPVLSVDARGDLHLAWIGEDAQGRTRIQYLHGKRE